MHHRRRRSTGKANVRAGPNGGRLIGVGLVQVQEKPTPSIGGAESHGQEHGVPLAKLVALLVDTEIRLIVERALK